MSTVVIDGATRDKLLAAGGPVEVLDEAGNPVGRFVRFVKYTRIGEYVVEGEWPSDEEIERRLRESRRFTVAQVEERLRKLKEALG